MADLTATTPCAGLLPLTIGAQTLDEEVFDAITSVAPFRGQAKSVSAALKAQMGAGFPGPGRATGKADARAVWAGRAQALVLGPALDPIAGAAMTDQTDGWACVALSGPGAREVLRRLVPVDIRPDVFKRGHAARTTLGHMHCLLLRTGADRYGILVFRSMAATLVHELKEAMETVAARD